MGVFSMSFNVANSFSEILILTEDNGRIIFVIDGHAEEIERNTHVNTFFAGNGSWFRCASGNLYEFGVITQSSFDDANSSS